MTSSVVEVPQVKSTRLVATLALAGMLAGTLIVSVFQKTLPAIEAHKALVLEQSVQEVLGSPDWYDTLYVLDDALSLQAPAGANPARMERVFVGYTDQGRIGYAMTSGEPGFQDIIKLIFGYNHSTGEVLGMKVLESKETPGLGDKIEKDMDFVTSFNGVVTPIVGKKAGTASAPGEIDMITGATISSKAVIRIINNKLERLRPMLDSYEASL